MRDLDEQRDQLRGAVADDDVRAFRAAVVSDRLPQRRVFPVRIGHDRVDPCRKLCPKPRRDAQGIDIGGKAGDLFFFDMVDGFDLFQIASVKMVSVFYQFPHPVWIA